MSGFEICLAQNVALVFICTALLVSVCLNITLCLLRRRNRYSIADETPFAYGEEEQFHPNSVPADRSEDDEMERRENPIYGNICFEGGGSFGMAEEHVCYESMSQASTSKKVSKIQQGDVSYASLDLTANKKRRKKRRYQKQAQTHQAQTHSPPVPQQNCHDQDPEADVTLPSRTSSLMLSRHSIYLNSHQVALEAEEREREKERERTEEREFEIRNLNDSFDCSLETSRPSPEEER